MVLLSWSFNHFTITGLETLRGHPLPLALEQCLYRGQPISEQVLRCTTLEQCPYRGQPISGQLLRCSFCNFQNIENSKCNSCLTSGYCNTTARENSHKHKSANVYEFFVKILQSEFQIADEFICSPRICNVYNYIYLQIACAGMSYLVIARFGIVPAVISRIIIHKHNRNVLLIEIKFWVVQNSLKQA